MITRIAIAAAALAVAAPAAAQNASLEPNFGSVTLSAGFEEDPHAVDIIAGGDIDASRLGGDCVGYISDAPDYRLTYTAGSYPLAIGAVSGTDTTIVIKGPDGNWYCDDDSFEDGDPIFLFTSPRSGQYSIWVGTFEAGDGAEARLAITEQLGQ